MSPLIPPQNGRRSNSERFSTMFIPTNLSLRSRFDLFGLTGCSAQRLRSADLKNASTSSHGERLLRAARWHDSPGVSGLSHSGERTALAPDSERIRCLLQSSTPSFCSRPWNSRAHSAGQKRQPTGPTNNTRSGFNEHAAVSACFTPSPGKPRFRRRIM